MKTIELWAAEQIDVSVGDIVSVQTQTDPFVCGHNVSPDCEDREQWPIESLVHYGAKITTAEQVHYVEIANLADFIAWFAS